MGNFLEWDTHVSVDDTFFRFWQRARCKQATNATISPAKYYRIKKEGFKIIMVLLWISVGCDRKRKILDKQIMSVVGST